MSVRALHDVVYDLPEDFFQRIESGVDEDTRKALRAGIEAGREITRLRNWAWVALVVGLACFIIGIATDIVVSGVFVWFLGLAALSFVVALVVYLSAASSYLAHRQDLHRFLAFVRAERGSSLGRDLS